MEVGECTEKLLPDHSGFSLAKLAEVAAGARFKRSVRRVYVEIYLAALMVFKLHVLEELASLDVLTHNEIVDVVFKKLVDLQDVGVGHITQDVDFILKQIFTGFPL